MKLSDKNCQWRPTRISIGRARRIAAWTLPRATPESEQEQRRKLEQRLRKTDFSGMSADAADLLVFQQCVLAEIAKLEHSLVSGEQQPGEQTIPTCGVHILEYLLSLFGCYRF